MTHVALCIPHAAKVHPEFERTLAYFLQANTRFQFSRVEVDLMIIGKARNLIIETGRTQSPDVYFFIDDDVLIPHTAGVLIDLALNFGIASGVYYSRRYPFTPEIFVRATEPEFVGRAVYWPYLEMPDSGIFNADAVGAGCLAVSATVFDDMERHYRELFRQQSELLSDPLVKEIVANLSPWFEFLDRKGEDMYFCELARALGYSIWVDGDIQCTHIGENPITQQHFQQMRNAGALRKEIKQ